jgi:integrase
MGSVFRKTTTRPVPAGATITTKGDETFARWKTRSGKWITATVATAADGRPIIRQESSTYFAKHRGADGIVHVVPTGCRDETNARQFLADLEKQADRVRAGVVTPQELAIADRKHDPLEEHLGDYLATLTGSSCYRDNTERYIRRLAVDCQWSCVADMKRFDLERWLADEARKGRSARSRNGFREAMITFCNWCKRNKRMPENPFHDLPKAKTKTDPRRERRALTEAEVARLLDVARDRPLRDAQRINRGPRKGQRVAKLSDARRRALEAQGRFRVIVYRTLLATGIRMGELAALKVADLDLDAPVPCIRLRASTTKNSEEAFLPLRADLVAALKGWLLERFGSSGPGTPPANAIVFEIPEGFLRVLNRDLKAAGIPKRDERGRTIDLHGLRTTFGTMLSKSGVPPRVAQQLMRHSDIRLTMGVYTDPKLFDLQGAVEQLPSVAAFVAPSVAPTTVNLVQPESSSGNDADSSDSPQVPISKPKRRDF